MSTHRFTARAAVLGVLGAGLFGLTAGTASAHVHAKADDAAKGGYAAITFSVPNERDDAGTVKVSVDFPADTPVASASTKPVPGWTAKVTTKKLDKPVQFSEEKVTEAVRNITWTAEKDTRINPEEFQEFEVSAGPLPENTDTLLLPTAQTYDSGEVVRWNQETKPGAEEPEHPSPSIELAAEESDGHHATEASNATSGGDTEQAAGGSDSDDTARWLGGGGLALGALGLGLGAGALLRSRRSGTSG